MLVTLSQCLILPPNEIDMYLEGLSPHVRNTVAIYLLQAKSIIDDIDMYHVNREYMYAIIWYSQNNFVYFHYGK